MTTVEDILGSSQTLKERAKAAHFAQQQATSVEHAAQQEGLIDDTIRFLESEFGVLPSDADGIEFETAARENNFPVARFRFGGIWFRASYAKAIVNISSHTKIDEVNFRMQVTNASVVTSATTWQVITSLADLGRVLI